MRNDSFFGLEFPSALFNVFSDSCGIHIKRVTVRRGKEKTATITTVLNPCSITSHLFLIHLIRMAKRYLSNDMITRDKKPPIVETESTTDGSTYSIDTCCSWHDCLFLNDCSLRHLLVIRCLSCSGIAPSHQLQLCLLFASRGI